MPMLTYVKLPVFRFVYLCYSHQLRNPTKWPGKIYNITNASHTGVLGQYSTVSRPCPSLLCLPFCIVPTGNYYALFARMFLLCKCMFSPMSTCGLSGNRPCVAHSQLLESGITIKVVPTLSGRGSLDKCVLTVAALFLHGVDPLSVLIFGICSLHNLCIARPTQHCSVLTLILTHRALPAFLFSSIHLREPLPGNCYSIAYATNLVLLRTMTPAPSVLPPPLSSVLLSPSWVHGRPRPECHALLFSVEPP